MECSSQQDSGLVLLDKPRLVTTRIELDADTEEAEGEDKMTTKEAQKIVMGHFLPKATSRKNVQLPEYVFLRGGYLAPSPSEEKA